MTLKVVLKWELEGHVDPSSRKHLACLERKSVALAPPGAHGITRFRRASHNVALPIITNKAREPVGAGENPPVLLSFFSFSLLYYL